MSYLLPVTEIIESRRSCRSYTGYPINGEIRARLERTLAEPGASPFGSTVRFRLAAAAAEDGAGLKDLGTYGMVRNPSAFIIGAVRGSGNALVDYGYLMEKAVLAAVDLGLDTCWIRGTFRKSSFEKRIWAENRTSYY